jgi:hypothetical protein
MEIDAKIDILFCKNNESPHGIGLQIRIYDDTANVEFVNLFLKPENLIDAFGRLIRTPVDFCEVKNLDKVGRTHIIKTITCLMPKADFDNRKETAYQTAKEYCKEFYGKDWIVRNYFSSQDSFFEKDGKEYCHATIEKWIDSEDKD